MAARAHVVRDDMLPAASGRLPGQVWLSHGEYDAVELPRGRERSFSAALIVSAVLATGLVVGAASAVYWASLPPALAETPELPLLRSWTVDPEFTRANVALAQRRPEALDIAATLTPGDAQDRSPPRAKRSHPAATSIHEATKMSDPEVVFDDSAPGFQESLPQPEPSATSMPSAEMPEPEPPRLSDEPFPDPSTIPPDLPAPVIDDGATSPHLDPANPYVSE